MQRATTLHVLIRTANASSRTILLPSRAVLSLRAGLSSAAPTQRTLYTQPSQRITAARLPRISFTHARRFEHTAANGDSATVKNLRDLLERNDVAGFHAACKDLEINTHALASAARYATSGAMGMSKAVASPVAMDTYHFLLETMASHPALFTDKVAGATPIGSALGLITDMSEASNANGNLRPDKETLLLLLRVTSSACESPSQGQSAWMIADAIRHGRLPVLMSSEQWELPKHDIALDKDLWTALFNTVQAAGRQLGPEQSTTMAHQLADQLCKDIQSLEMDDQLWQHVIKAFGDSNSVSSIDRILESLPPIGEAKPEVYARVAESFARSNRPLDAFGLLKSIKDQYGRLPMVDPVAALAKQYAAKGNISAIRHIFSTFQSQGENGTDLIDAHGWQDLNRIKMHACASALTSLFEWVSAESKRAHTDHMPSHILTVLGSPSQLSKAEYNHARFAYVNFREAESQLPASEWTLDDYDVAIQVYSRLNLLHYKEWPLERSALPLLYGMREKGLKPLRSSYTTLMAAMARTRQFNANRENGQAFKRVLKLMAMMEEDGHRLTKAQDFQPLLETCFGYYPSSPFAPGLFMYINNHISVWPEGLRKAESLMKKKLGSKISADKYHHDQDAGERFHDAATLATVLAGLTHGGEVVENWERWRNLPLDGIQRTPAMYQAMIAASRMHLSSAEYCLKVVRYEMLKENPLVPMTSDIFAGLMDCCIRTKDAQAAKSVISQAQPRMQKNASWLGPMVKTCLWLPELQEEGSFMLQQLKESTSNLSTDMYTYLMDYLVNRKQDYRACQGVFSDFMRSEHERVLSIQQGSADQPDAVLAERPGSISGDEAFMSDEEVQHRKLLQQLPVAHVIETLDISPRTAPMVNLLVLSHVREWADSLAAKKRRKKNAVISPQEQERFDAGQRSFKEAQEIMGILTKTLSRTRKLVFSDNGQQEQQVSSASSKSSSSSSSSKDSSNKEKQSSLLYVNKYVLGEYIAACLKAGTSESLKDAELMMVRVLPRVVRGRRETAKLQKMVDVAIGKRTASNDEIDHDMLELVADDEGDDSASQTDFVEVKS
ncbi:hypothetical protein DFQ26_006929 [Actinomortierella ambigua]|nr:hypothetical protein DFQ26_006929 [Actinomortierella ambigua]